MANAVELANAYITLVPSLRGSQAAITRELVPGAEAAGDTAGGRSAGAFTAAFGKVAAKATAIGSAIAVGMTIKGGIARALNIEDAESKLSGLGHTAEAVTGIMGNAMASVKGTAFGMGDAAAVAAGAVASGVAPGQELERTLGLVADAATIAGTDMGSMGAIFNKVGAANKIQGDIIAQLGDRGIPIVALLAKELGVTSAEVTKLAAKGEIDFATFQNAIETGMGGAALKSGETTRGALKNMGAAFARLGEAAIVPLLPKFRDMVGGLTTFAGVIASQAGPAVTNLMAWFGDLSAGVGAFWNEYLAPHMPLLADLAGKLGAVGQEILAGVGPAMQNLGQFIFDAAGKVRDFSNWLRENEGVAIAIAATIGAVMLPALVRWGVGATVAAAKNVAAWAVSSSAGTRAGVSYVVSSFTVVGSWIAMGAAAVKSGAQTVAIWALYQAEAIKGAAAYVLNGARVAAAWVAMSAAAVASGIKTAAVWVGSVVASAAVGAASFLVQTAIVVGGWVLMGVQSLIQGARMAAAWVLAMGPVGWVIAAVVALVALIIANWDAVASTTAAVWGAVSGFLSGLWNGIKNTATNIWNGLVSFVMGIPGRVLSGLMYLASLHMQMAAWIGSVKDAAVNKFLELVGWVGGLPGRILSSLGNLGGLLLNAGTQIIQGFLNGLKNKFEEVKGFVGGIGQWIADHKGPKAYDLGLLVPAGGWIMDGLGSGLEAGLPGVRKVLGRVGNEVAAGLNVPGTAALNARGSLGLTDYAVAGAGAPSSPAPVYVQNPFTGEYLLARVDTRVGAGISRANDDIGRRRAGVRG